MQPNSINSQPSNSNQGYDKARKKIKNAGRSSVALGLLLALISLAGVSVLASDGVAVYVLVSLVIYVVLYTVITILGFSLKKTVDVGSALSKISRILILSIITIVISIIGGVLSQKGIGLGPMLTAVLVIYLIVAKVQIKKLS